MPAAYSFGCCIQLKVLLQKTVKVGRSAKGFRLQQDIGIQVLILVLTEIIVIMGICLDLGIPTVTAEEMVKIESCSLCLILFFTVLSSLMYFFDYYFCIGLHHQNQPHPASITTCFFTVECPEHSPDQYQSATQPNHCFIVPPALDLPKGTDSIPQS